MSRRKASKDEEAFQHYVGLRLREERRRSGVTFDDLSAASGMHKRDLILYELGDRPIRAYDLWKLAVLWGLPVDSFLPPR